MKRPFYFGPIVLVATSLLSGCSGSSTAAASVAPVPAAAGAPPTAPDPANTPTPAPAPLPTSAPTPAPAPPPAVSNVPLGAAITAQQLAQLEDEGKLPKLDRSESIAGPDTNMNGVRDDIDAYMMKRFPNVPQRAAAIQMARAVQKAVLAGNSNPDASADASQKLNDAINCLWDRFKGSTEGDYPAAVSDEIEAITANTKARLRAYLAYNKSRDGTSNSLSEGETCE